MNICIRIITLFFSLVSFAQVEDIYKAYTWDEKSIENFDASKHQSEEVIAIKEKEVHDFVLLNQKSFIEYKLIHNILWLNSNNKIEDYNKVYLPIYSQSQLVTSKARVITSSKKIIELDASKILEAKNEETNVTYKYFALEGVEKGAFVEYFYITKNNPTYTGNRVALQSDYKKYNVDFEVTAPSNLEFEFKTYNELPEIKKDTLVTDKNHWKLHLDEVKALQPEEKSPYATLVKQVVYKLDRNVDNPTIRFSDYWNHARNSSANIYRPSTKKTRKAIKKFIDKLKIPSKLSAVEKLRIIEHELKPSIYTSPNISEGIDDISSILKTKIANEYAMIKVYAALLQFLDIESELVFTSNRTTLKFDTEFEAYNFLDKCLFYLVNENSYLDPLDVSSRLGFPNGYLTDNYGLFIEPVKLDNFTSDNVKVKYIAAVDYKESTDSLFVDIKINQEDFNTVNLNFKQTFTGYKAIYVQPYIHLSQTEDRDELLKNILTQYYPNANIIASSFDNVGKSDFGVLPLVINAKVSSENYINKAGRKYLFKIGELIGPQLEMYQDKKRTLVAEDPNTKYYYRKLNFSIPAGYDIKNLESLKLNEAFKNEKEETIFLFKSSYELKGNQLTVIIEEFYNENIIPASIYENYRKVINSAADFNKITLILEPKA